MLRLGDSTAVPTQNPRPPPPPPRPAKGAAPALSPPPRPAKPPPPLPLPLSLPLPLPFPLSLPLPLPPLPSALPFLPIDGCGKNLSIGSSFQVSMYSFLPFLKDDATMPSPIFAVNMKLLIGPKISSTFPISSLFSRKRRALKCGTRTFVHLHTSSSSHSCMTSPTSSILSGGPSGSGGFPFPPLPFPFPPFPIAWSDHPSAVAVGDAGPLPGLQTKI